MEMMNRAIEDAADFKDMMRRLESVDQLRSRELEAMRENVEPEPHSPVKRPGENRQQYRARLRQMKVKA